jgi:cytoskeletal protein CcmA (bactofilin family)
MFRFRNAQWAGKMPARHATERGAKAMADYESIRRHWNRIQIADSPVDSGGDADADAETSSSQALHSDGGTFIASGAIFEGTLTLKGDFRIDTEFRGELETDGTITVGPEGTVVGNIRAREVVIRGAVVGDVFAPRQLIVEPTGKLHGDIETACLEIQKHAFFKGNTSMTQPQAYRRLERAEALEQAAAPAPF